jgi:hypothetical protein
MAADIPGPTSYKNIHFANFPHAQTPANLSQTRISSVMLQTEQVLTLFT